GFLTCRYGNGWLKRPGNSPGHRTRHSPHQMETRLLRLRLTNFVSQSPFEFAASLANRSAFKRCKFRRNATCSFSYSVTGLSEGRDVLFASFSRLLMMLSFSNCWR